MLMLSPRRLTPFRDSSTEILVVLAAISKRQYIPLLFDLLWNMLPSLGTPTLKGAVPRWRRFSVARLDMSWEIIAAEAVCHLCYTRLSGHPSNIGVYIVDWPWCIKFARAWLTSPGVIILQNGPRFTVPEATHLDFRPSIAIHLYMLVHFFLDPQGIGIGCPL